MGAGGARRRILVTGAAGPAGRALATGLVRAGETREVWAIGADMAPVAVPGYEAVELVAPAVHPRYEEDMLALVAGLEPDLVLPTVSEELARIATLGVAVGWGHRLVGSAPGPAAVAGDKLLTMWSLARAGAAVPTFACASRFRSAAQVLDWADGPVVIKPRVARGGRGVHVLDDPDDRVWGRVDESWLVQAFAPGTEYSPQVYRSPATGACTVVVLRKAALEHGRVGNATAVDRVPDGEEADVADLAERTVRALDLVGPVDMDVRRLADGTAVVLEVNARFGAVSASAPELLDAVLDDWPG